MPGAFFACKNNRIKFSYIIEEKIPKMPGKNKSMIY